MLMKRGSTALTGEAANANNRAKLKANGVNFSHGFLVYYRERGWSLCGGKLDCVQQTMRNLLLLSLQFMTALCACTIQYIYMCVCVCVCIYIYVYVSIHISIDIP